MEQYKNGFCLYGFDLSPDWCEEGEHFNLVKSGNIRLCLRFAKALPNAVTAICYSEFENVIEIDKKRQILFDFSS